MQDLADRARFHHALSDVQRLSMVDALWFGDRTPSELADDTGLASNHLAFHLNVLVAAGIVRRTASEGDARRRYVGLTDHPLLTPPPVQLHVRHPLFVCTRNAARSRLAAAIWLRTTGCAASSAGRAPAPGVDTAAARAAQRHRLPFDAGSPRGYETLTPGSADLVISVCDRAHEAPVPFEAPNVHWSIADPSGAPDTRYDEVIADLQLRVARLALAAGLIDIDAQELPVTSASAHSEAR